MGIVCAHWHRKAEGRRLRLRKARSCRLLFRQEPVPAADDPGVLHWVTWVPAEPGRPVEELASREAHRFAVEAAMPGPSCPSSSSSPKLSLLRATRSQRRAGLPAELPSAARPGRGVPSALRCAEAASMARARFPQAPAPLHKPCSPLLDRCFCRSPAAVERRSMSTPGPRRNLQDSRSSPAARLACAMMLQAGRLHRHDKTSDLPSFVIAQAGAIKG